MQGDPATRPAPVRPPTAGPAVDRSPAMPLLFRLRALRAPLGLAAAGLISVLVPQPLRAHGAGGGEALAPGTFQIAPVLTLEGHAGLENNLEGHPRHYALDGLIGIVLEWGLPNSGSLAIEAMVGPALVWGEAEHFYGRVHRDAGHDEGDGHADDHRQELDRDHGHTSEEAHGDGHEADGSEHRPDSSEDDHAHHGESHGGHDDDDPDHSHDHSHSDGAPYRRTDIKGWLQVRYAPDPRWSFFAEWKPYYVTRSQQDDIRGLKNEIGVGMTWALGDGDLNFALGDGLETIADGVFLSLENRTGWESDGTYLGNYTDPWLGLGFNIDRLNVTLSGGPRFYAPGRYAGLPNRTDWGGELALELPVSPRTVLFAHWTPIYSSQDGEGWGQGWQHHVGTGVTIRF